VTPLRQIMLEELERRNYASATILCYIRTVEHFARHFHRSPDQPSPEHIRQYQAAMFREWKAGAEHREAATGGVTVLLCSSVEAGPERRRDALSERADLRNIQSVFLKGIAKTRRTCPTAAASLRTTLAGSHCPVSLNTIPRLEAPPE
jgi:hypothetical protein